MLKITQCCIMGEPRIVKTGFILNDHQENKRERNDFMLLKQLEHLKHTAEMSPHWHICEPYLPLSVFNNS